MPNYGNDSYGPLTYRLTGSSNPGNVIALDSSEDALSGSGAFTVPELTTPTGGNNARVTVGGVSVSYKLTGDYTQDRAAGTTQLRGEWNAPEVPLKLGPAGNTVTTPVGIFPASPSDNTVGGTMSATFDVSYTGAISGAPALTADESPGQMTGMEWFERTLGALGYTLSYDMGDKKWKLNAPATEDRVFGGILTAETVSRDSSRVPSQIVVTGGSTTLLGGAGTMSPTPTLSVSGQSLTVSWAGLPISGERPAAYRVRLSGPENRTADIEGGLGAGWSATFNNLSQGMYQATVSPMTRQATGPLSSLLSEGPTSQTASAAVGYAPLTYVDYLVTPAEVKVRIPVGVAPAILATATGPSGETDSEIVSPGQELIIGTGGTLDVALETGDTVSLRLRVDGQADLTQSFTLPADVIEGLSFKALARRVYANWKALQPGALVTVRLLDKDGQEVYLGQTTRSDFMIGNLIPDRAYTLRVSAGDVNAPYDAEEAQFRTSDDLLDDLSAEEAFEISSSGSYTSVARSESETLVDGQIIRNTTTTTTTNEKKDDKLVRTLTVVDTMAVAPVYDPQTDETRIEQIPTRTSTEVTYRYELAEHPYVCTGTRSFTQTATAGAITTVVEVLTKDWHERGWVSSEANERSETVQVEPVDGGPPQTVSVRNDSTIRTWTRSGIGTWTLHTRSQQTVTLETQEGQRPIITTQTESTPNSSPPEMIPAAQFTGADLQLPAPGSGGAPGPDPEPPTFPDEPPEPGQEPTGPASRQVALSARRTVGGRGPTLRISLPNLITQGQVDAAAEEAVRNLGRPIMTASRTYASPVGASVVGAVRSVRVSFQDGLYSESVETQWLG